jgi:hypothetical protein
MESLMKSNNKQTIKPRKLMQADPETELLNGILVKVSGHKRESSHTRDFYSHFSVLQNAIHEDT